MIYYFGCWDEQGHHLRSRGGALLWNVPEQSEIDSQLLDDCNRWCPAARIDFQDERLDRVTILPIGDQQWTVWGMWDKSVDTRPGCFALFLAAGRLTREQVFAEAIKAFPQIVLRLRKRRSALGGTLPWPETVF